MKTISIPQYPQTFRPAFAGPWVSHLRTALCALLLAGLVPAAMAQKVATAAGISKPAYVAEVRTQLQRAGVDRVNTDAIVAALDRLSMTEIVALSDGARAGQLERLLPGTAISPPPGNPVDAARGTGGSTGSASQQALQGMQDNRGGFIDARGHVASCHACPGGGFAGSGSGQNPHDSDARGFTTKSGTTISIYGDGSAKIQGANGKTEYINSQGQLVNAANRPVTPDPNAESPSGILTAAEIKGLEVLLGKRITPTGEVRGTGGGGTTPTRTETLGLFTENRTVGRIGIAQLQEIMRIAAEKLGPKVGRP